MPLISEERCTIDYDAPAESRAGFSGSLILILLLLAGLLVFAHGCHGDEDNELFAAGARFSYSFSAQGLQWWSATDE